MSETREQQARELAQQIDLIEYGPDHRGFFEIEEVTALLVRALAACALAEARESKQALLAARSFVRGRHSTLSYGPRVLLEQLDLALNRIERLERAAGEGKS